MEYMVGVEGHTPFKLRENLETMAHAHSPSSFMDKETESQKGKLPKVKQLRGKHWTAAMDEGRAAMNEEAQYQRIGGEGRGRGVVIPGGSFQAL